MKILLIEDDTKTAAFVTKGLEEAVYMVSVANDGETGLQMVKESPFDLAIVDVMLPKLDGLSLIEQMRAAQIHTPVIVLSARNSVEDRVRGLQAGCDIYLVKPFSFSELLANIQAQLRRNSISSQPTTLEVADLSMDLVRRKVSRGSRAIELQTKEFQLLEYLMRNSPRVITKAMIMEHVWGYSFDPQTNIVEARIYKLREKVERPGERPLIHTVRGVGYVLE